MKWQDGGSKGFRNGKIKNVISVPRESFYERIFAGKEQKAEEPWSAKAVASAKVEPRFLLADQHIHFVTAQAFYPGLLFVFEKKLFAFSVA
ncbi:hypothetical protein ACQYAD_09420 [Neobacillus sp. SM06]|uniref:hypothetical protein n=1 Tax=Neobacillus sp. SM06 TaxID=3422492 RepID=UPI003D2698B6